MKTLLLLTALMCLCAKPSLALTYEMQDLGAIFPYDINNSGQLAGAMGASDGMSHAFTWKNGRTTDLGVGCGYGVNDLGQVIFYSGTVSNCEAAIWRDGSVTGISGIVPVFGNPLAINNSGQVVCTTAGASASQGWIWQSGNLTYLGTTGALGSYPVALNNVGQVIGYTMNANNYVGSPFIWQEEMSSIPGLPTADTLAGINDCGQIVGDDWRHDEDHASWTEAFILQNGTKTFLGNLSSPTAFWRLSHATGINNQGQVVGWANTSDSDARSHAFVWQDGVMSDLGTLGGTYSRASAINDNGWIVGSSEIADGQYHGVLWIPVPEPSSMLGVLAGLVLVSRRRHCGKDS